MHGLLREVNWRKPGACYGNGDELTILISDLASANTEKREEALAAIYESIEHQGANFQASSYIVPFLIDVLPHLSGREQVRLLLMLASLAGGAASQALPAMAKALQVATPREALAIGGAMIMIAFEGKPVARDVSFETLSPEQMLALSAIADSDQYWMNRVSLMLANVQLPFMRIELRTFLQGVHRPRIRF
jgi:hypothetical protein